MLIHICMYIYFALLTLYFYKLISSLQQFTINNMKDARSDRKLNRSLAIYLQTFRCISCRYTSSSSSSSSSSRSIRTDRWVHFQQNTDLRLNYARHRWLLPAVNSDIWGILPSVCPSCSWNSSLFCSLQLHLEEHSKLFF